MPRAFRIPYLTLELRYRLQGGTTRQAFELTVIECVLNQDFLQVQLLENWRQHVQKGLQIACSRYARLRLAQAGEKNDNH